MSRVAPSLAMIWVVALVLPPAITRANPPEPGTEDFEILYPHAHWMQSVHDQDGRWCCDIADGRPVPARVRVGHWEVFVSSTKFVGAPDAWVEVPEHAVKRIANPVGLPIAWWYSGQVRCFVPGDGM